MADDATSRIIIEAMRQSRENALDAAIEVCQMFADSGHSAACCVQGLQDLKDSMNQVVPVPSSMQ